MSPPDSKKSKTSALFSFAFGCRDKKSVSVSTPISRSSDLDAAPPLRPLELSSSSGDTLFTSSSFVPEREPELDSKSEGATTFSGLLRELSDLEQCVKDCGVNRQFQSVKSLDRDCRSKHRRSLSEGRVDESVAVVKDSADPFGDFRQSMLQMIVEKEIVDAQELRELLRRFLDLNSKRYHGMILRAFFEIWNEVFSGYESTPELLRAPNLTDRFFSLHNSNHPRRH